MKVKSDKHRYSLSSIIFVGAFGNTYLGIDEEDPEKQFQITVEDKDRIQDPESYSQVMTEHEILMTLHHPTLLNCNEIFEDDLHYYLVFDYFSDQTLERRYLGLQRISEEKLQFIFQQLIEMVMLFHNHGYAIGSFKPENILINERYEIVLCNFSSVQSLTLPIAKENFIVPPPEIYNQCQSNSSCEVFALGVLLYMIASHGTKPWDTCYEIELKTMYQSSALMQPPSMSPLCFSLVKEMLEADPAKRLTLTQVKQHQWVQKAIARVKIQLSHVTIPSPISERKRRASTMKSLLSPEKKRKGGNENNPAFANVNINSLSPSKSFRHRQSVIPKCVKLPKLDL